MFSRRYRFIFVGLGIFGAIVYLLFSGIRAEGVPYLKISELVSESNTKAQTVKITGKVEKGSLNYKPKVPLLNFSVSGPETKKTIRVSYEGIKPDALRENGHVILEGKYDPVRKKLDAYSLLAKCPSRYKSKYESYESKTAEKSS